MYYVNYVNAMYMFGCFPKTIVPPRAYMTGVCGMKRRNETNGLTGTFVFAMTGLANAVCQEKLHTTSMTVNPSCMER